MKKAVIRTGSKQYIVSEGDILTVEKLDTDKKIDFKPLLVIDGEMVTIGTPIVDSVKVNAEVLEADKLADKTTSVRYKAKKRVHTVQGHRQHVTVLKISKIV